MEMTRKSASKQEADAQRSLAEERKRLPKTLRSESKTRSMMFKESLRINHVYDESDIDMKIRQFEEKVSIAFIYIESFINTYTHLGETTYETHDNIV
jgi:hypothetical protein